ncbi:MAG: glycosyltransferase family 39 protein [Polyangiaceae bacterium]|nr:glycosyltransferase family 39 protein [Polyangiaceae bacterium]MCW5792132.1 glycosyltransferase family 39 protein [Polyangiaceae bacterium]
MVWSSDGGRPVGAIGQSASERAGRLLEGALWLVVALCALQILMFSFGRDQGIYAVVGSGVLDGQMPYRDLWDFKPPGIFLIYALAEALFGKAMWGVRVLEVMGLLGMVFSMRKISSTIAGDPLAGTLGGAVAALVHAQLEFWHTAQPETFGGYLTVFALMLTLSDDLSSRRVYRWIGTGALFGAAFLLKPPLGGGALVCAAYLARREWLHGANRLEALRPIVVMALSALLPVAAVCAWFWLRGAWGALAFTLFEFTPGYTALGWEGRSAPSMLWWGFTQCFFRYSALAPVAILAALLMRPAHSREREGTLLVFGVIAMHLTGVAMQGKFFPYHYGATFPLLAVLAGVGLLKLWRLCHAGGPGGVLAFMSFTYLLVVTQTATVNLNQSFWGRSQARFDALTSGQWPRDPGTLDSLYVVADYDLGADRAVAKYLREQTEVTDWVLVWGFEPAVYWLSERRPATKYIYNVAQRASWDRERAREDLLSELALTPPSVIVVQHQDIFPAVTGDNLDSARSLQSFSELEALVNQRFRLARRIQDFDVYVLAPEAR